MTWEITDIMPLKDRNHPNDPLWVQAKSEDGRWKVSCKWDGCIELWEQSDYYPGNYPPTLTHLHLCDLDEFIALMIDLRDNVESLVLQ